MTKKLPELGDVVKAVPEEENDLTGTREKKPSGIKSLGDKKEKKSFSPVRFLLILVLVSFVVTVFVAVLVAIASNFKLINFAEIFAAIEGAILIISITIVLLFAVVVAGVYSVYVYFAPRDLFWGGKPEEGTACTIVAGTENKKGSFVKAEISYVGHKLAKNWNVIPDENFQAGKKSFLERIGLGGIFWIGFPKIRRRHKDSFSWTTILDNGEFENHNGVFDYISLKEDTYVVLIPKVETTESMVPMDITMLMTAQVINPMKARHKVDHWLQSIAALIKAPTVKLIAQMDSPRDLIGNEELTKVFYNKLEKSKDIKYFRDVYGVEVSRVEVIAIDLDKEAEDIAKKKWKNEQEAAAFIVEEEGKGTGYSKRIGIQTEADVDRIRRINSEVSNFGDLGRDIEYLKSAEKSGSMILPPPGMIGDALKQALGGNKSSNEIVKLIEGENLTEEDIKNFVKMVKTMREKDEEE